MVTTQSAQADTESPGGAAQTPSTFRRLAMSMGAFGVVVGLLFPPFAWAMLHADAAYDLSFWMACVAAGIVVGLANFTLAYVVVGGHVRRLAQAMNAINERAVSGGATGGGCANACQVPITSSDALGEVEVAFNAMARSVANRIRLEVMVGEMASSASESAELDRVARAVLEGLMRALDTKTGLLYAISGTEPRRLVHLGFDPPPSIPLDLTSGPVEEALRTREPVVLDPEAAGLAWLTQSTPLGSLRPKTVLLLPLCAEQRTIALAVFGIPSASANPTQQQILDGCRRRAGPLLLNALLHKKLQEMAALDELTGVLNRRFGMRRLREEYARSLRHGVPLAVFLLDIDHFKQFNDTHGHDAGDEVLRHVARTMDESMRSSDVVCRYGGEEFLVLAPGAGTTDGSVLADRLRRKIESMDVQWKKQRLAVHASFGVASWPAVSASSPEDLVTRADEALYQAKGGGRNCVFVHDGTKTRPGNPETGEPTEHGSGETAR